MFIEEVMATIRVPYSLRYKKALENAEKIENKKLYQIVLKDTEKIIRYTNLIPIEGVDFKVTLLNTTGCPHWLGNGKVKMNPLVYEMGTFLVQ